MISKLRGLKKFKFAQKFCSQDSYLWIFGGSAQKDERVFPAKT